MGTGSSVTVLMSTYNGQRFLREQLESVLAQIAVTPRIIVRDDGSSDDTARILRQYERQGMVQFSLGRNCGPSGSFMKQVFDAPIDSYYAFCDQDDVWLADKLYTALNHLDSIPRDQPALYFSGLTAVDDKLLRPRSIVASGPPTLASAMVANPGAGCTYVFNRALMEILRMHPGRYSGTHDSWVLRVCLAIGGVVLYDFESHILYRQHRNNAVGVRALPIRLYRRLVRYTSREHPRESAARTLLELYSDLMPPENVSLLNRFAFYRESFARRLDLARDTKFVSGSFEQRVIFKLAVLLGGL